MKVIYMTSSSSLSGGTRQAMYQARGMMERGHDVTFFVPHNAEITGLDDGIQWIHLPEKRSEWKAEVQNALPEPGTPSIVHAFHNKANKKLAWWGLGLRKRGAVCLGYRGVIYRPSNPLPYWSPGIDCFTANSHACGKVLRSVGLPEKRLEVVYNGIPTSRITPAVSRKAMRSELGVSKTDLVFGTVAGDKPVKGVEWLLKGFAKAVQSGLDAKLVLVGARPKRWDSLAAELGITDRIFLRGRVENVADHLQAFDVFLLPSLSESMPNVLLEAFFFGLPAIASDIGGVPELVDGNGLLVPPKDPDAIARAMGKALDPDLRRIWSKASFAAAPQFTIDAKIRRSVEVYNLLLERRGFEPQA